MQDALSHMQHPRGGARNSLASASRALYVNCFLWHLCSHTKKQVLLILRPLTASTRQVVVWLKRGSKKFRFKSILLVIPPILNPSLALTYSLYMTWFEGGEMLMVAIKWQLLLKWIKALKASLCYLASLDEEKPKKARLHNLQQPPQFWCIEK